MTDQNDNAPRFARPNYEFPLSSLNDTNIGRVQAIDDDLDSGGVVKFRLLQQIEVSSGISKLCYKETHGRRSEDVLHRSSSWTLHIKA